MKIYSATTIFGWVLVLISGAIDGLLGASGVCDILASPKGASGVVIIEDNIIFIINYI